MTTKHPHQKKHMNKKELTAALTMAGSDEARAEARIILEELFGADMAEQTMHPERDYDTEILNGVLRRRAEHEPLQYIIGHTYFCREKYILNSDCLIPRQDTELLVYKAAELLVPHAHFADLCTGTGCVAISTLCARTDTTAIACDISKGAVMAATENARINGVADRLRITESDIFNLPLGEERFDAILSNPPYIPSDVVKLLSAEVKHEPHRALDGGVDGMDFYRFIIHNYKNNLKPAGFFALEIGFDQEQAIKELALSEGFSCDVYKDAGGNARVAVLISNKGTLS